MQLFDPPVYDVLNELVNGKSDVSVDGEHLSQGVLILRGLQVSIQKTAYHV